jgi:FkbM family methyltransferase
VRDRPAPADVVTLRRRLGLFGAPRTVYRLLARSRRRRLFQAKRRLYGELVGHGDLCFDIGANVGDRARVLRSLGARVVAVEPQAGCVTWMGREFRRDARVEIVPSAAGAALGSATMHVPSAMHPLATLNPAFVERMQAGRRFDGVEWDARMTVPVTTLDALIATYGRPRFCKVDVEGYEDEVFAGLSEPIHVVSFEYNEELPAPAVASAARLAALGVTRFNVSLGETMELLWPTWRDRGAVLDFLDGLDGTLLHSYGDVYAMTPDRLRN